MSATESSRAFRVFSWFCLVCTLGVVLWGAYVRATGSGAGCGDHWPVCNGQVVPREPSVQTLIEYTHRLTSGLVMIFAVVLCVWALRAHAKGHPVRRAAVFSLVFMLTEAAVGAGLVLFKMVAHNESIARAFWMATHLLNTFLLVGAQSLTIWWAGGRERLVLRRQGLTGWLLAGSLVGLLVLGVSGAIAALGDTLFPATSLTEGLSQDVSPTAHILLRLRVLHPVLAVLVGAGVVFCAAMVARLRPSPSVRRSAWQLGVLYGLQLFAGMFNVVLLAPVWLQLVHLLLADLVWIVLLRLGAAGLALGAPRADVKVRSVLSPS
ncbi:Heme A synthase, cytochrome oxidase biogenesis protein Cox15-CtaA [Cystobacter fuscus DSM 2262]|uniref:Heme A synthase, cytochrome oxidase biogenesis protein Cox15-CtaA n=1 Tax=Cystobacter fuscus (strain ATCC 25194 / DSM 2262 / NBRC 100088 / M29) TaxID=1242864 RepID=S9P6F5_CYSF2|nr:COX15/CtaA family protein [Cystobacter fuscus]EPX60030.1 Heme A synthase, cytochrome oxidase biogenesis protein Cox15-CtaA [Cystobacter fuscus DSM 2262]